MKQTLSSSFFLLTSGLTPSFETLRWKGFLPKLVSISQKKKKANKLESLWSFSKSRKTGLITSCSLSVIKFFFIHPGFRSFPPSFPSHFLPSFLLAKSYREVALDQVCWLALEKANHSWDQKKFKKQNAIIASEINPILCSAPSKASSNPNNLKRSVVYTCCSEPVSLPSAEVCRAVYVLHPVYEANNREAE